MVFEVTVRQLNSASAGQAKSMEKLSSGLRINKAGDDAAGLAISEKMRAQVRGLDRASANAQDGISMIQTAEGALNETHDILQRMRELANQSSNGTNTSDDRKAIQDEVKQLKEEIDRIGNTTEFNTQKLLNGNLTGAGTASGVNSVTGANVFKAEAGKLTGVDSKAVDASSVDFTKVDTLLVDGKKVDIQWNKYLNEEDKALLDKNYTTVNLSADETKQVADIFEKAINSAIDDSGTGVAHVNVTGNTQGILVINSGSEGSNSKVELYQNAATQKALLADGTAVDTSESVFDNYFGASAELISNASATAGSYKTQEAITNNTDKFRITVNGHAMEINPTTVNSGSTVSSLASSLQSDINTAIGNYNTAAGFTGNEEIKDVEVKEVDGRIVISSPSGDVQLEEVTDGGTVLKKMGLDQASRESAGTGAMTFQIGANEGQNISFNIKDMRTNALGISGLDFSTQTGAQEGLSKLDNAIKSVSAERAKLGAVQNRLEHTINNLSTSSENLTAAESRIRDVDYALAA